MIKRQGQEIPNHKTCSYCTCRWQSHYMYVKIHGYIYVNVTYCPSHYTNFDVDINVALMYVTYMYM